MRVRCSSRMEDRARSHRSPTWLRQRPERDPEDALRPPRCTPPVRPTDRRHRPPAFPSGVMGLHLRHRKHVPSLSERRARRRVRREEPRGASAPGRDAVRTAESNERQKEWCMRARVVRLR
ncbi:Exonuclease SbcC [Microbacterium sp. 8M]|nr:Exonuclease SbcC [Microbacterium sp. 8M]